MAAGVAHRGPPGLHRDVQLRQHVEHANPRPAELDHVADHRLAGVARAGASRDRRLGAGLVAVRPGYADGRAGMGGQPQRGRPVCWLGDQSAPLGGGPQATAMTGPPRGLGTPATPQAGPPGRARPTPAGPARPAAASPRGARRGAGPGRAGRTPGRRSRPLRTGPPRSNRAPPSSSLSNRHCSLVEPRIVELPGHRQQIHLLDPDRHWCIDGHWRVLRHPCSPSARVTRAVMPPRVRDGRTTIAAAPGGVPTRDGSPLSRAGH